MRIERLDLVAFGPFTAASLDLSAPGLQVVYGPNEAGKSTARAAVSTLLYDFELRSRYAFVHPLAKLELAGRLVGEDGVALEVVRHKRNKDPLVEAGSGAPVAPARWAGLLQGVDRERFEALCSLGWQELLEGTAGLVADGGLLGEALFSAGLGVRELGGVLAELDAEASARYAPRASRREVNEALHAAREARRRATERSVRPERYEEVRRAHEEATTALRGCESSRSALERRHLALLTLRGALPALQARGAVLAERDALLAEVGGRRTPASWARRVAAAAEERQAARASSASAAAQVRQLDERQAGVVVATDVLAEADRIDALGEKVAAYLEGRADRGRLEDTRRQAERDALALLGLLCGRGAGRSLELARAALAARAAVGAAREAWAAAEVALGHLEAEVGELEGEADAHRRSLASLPDALDVTLLRQHVEATLRQGDLDAAVADARTSRALAARASTQAAGRVGWVLSQVPARLAAPWPTPAEVERAVADAEESARQAASADERAEGERRRRAALAAELSAVAAEGALPSEAELAATRQLRDARWGLVRAAWLDGVAPTALEPAYPDAASLAADLERSSAAADAAVDRLWQAADRTARRQGLEVELARVQGAIGAAEVEARTARAVGAAHFAAWRAAWASLEPPVRTEALRAWRDDLDRLRATDGEHVAARLAHRRAVRARREAAARLSELLAAHGVTPVGGDDLAPLVDQARRLVDAADRTGVQRLEATAALTRAETSLGARRRALGQARAAEKAAGDDVRSLLEPLGAQAASAREAAAVVSQLGELERLVERHDERLGRIQGIDVRSASFERELAAVRVALGAGDPAEPGPATGDAARALVARLTAAREREAARAALAEQRAVAEAAQEAAARALEGLGEALAALASEAGVDGAGDALLEPLERRAAAVLRLEALDGERVQLEHTLAQQAAGRPVAALAAEAAGRGLVDVNAELERCRLELEAAREREAAAAAEAQALVTELAAMDGTGAAAGETAVAELELGRALEGAAQYARLLLARHLADEAVRRYREAHQDPILARASEALARLTGGRWRAVVAEADRKGAPRLAAIGAGGDERSVGELSEGTRDQLYLALRLAAIEEAFARHGPVPVVLDDVLVNFDNVRAAAALAVFAALAERAQVLLFTHHRHVVELAQASLAAGRFALVELSGPRAS